MEPEETPIDDNETNNLGFVQQPTMENDPPAVSGSGSPATTTNDLAEWPPETVCTAAIELLDVVITRQYQAPLTHIEKATLNQAFVPVARKHLTGSMPVEYVALGALAMVVLPRHLAKRSQRSETHDDSSSAGSEGGGQESAFANAGMGSTSEVDKLLSGRA